MAFTIKQLEKPKNELNEELQWLCQSLGMFNERDKEKSCYRVFIQLLTCTRGLTSEEISRNTHITRGTVIHHINRLSEDGLVISQNGKYKLRANSLHRIIKELKEDLKEIFKEMEEIAQKIDKELESKK